MFCWITPNVIFHTFGLPYFAFSVLKLIKTTHDNFALLKQSLAADYLKLKKFPPMMLFVCPFHSLLTNLLFQRIDLVMSDKTSKIPIEKNVTIAFELCFYPFNTEMMELIHIFFRAGHDFNDLNN